MKTILVDAINGLVEEDGTLFEEMFDLLQTYPHQKIVLTGANDEQFKQFRLDQVPYPVFTLKHNPEKSDPHYYELLMEKFALSSADLIYFEHNQEAVTSARSVGISTYFYDHTKRDIASLKQFIDDNLST